MKKDLLKLAIIVAVITGVLTAASHRQGPILKPVLDPVARFFNTESQVPDVAATETALSTVESGTGPTSSTQTPPTPSPSSSSRDELIQFALDLINKDRAKYGLDPVELGSNSAAQIHADNMLEHRYLSHWTVDGLKPYMIYSMTGGDGYVAENAAYSGWTFEDYAANKCGSLFVNCQKVDAKKEIEDLEYRMMYDDASSNWGHRDNILRPYHQYVNIGIAYNDWFVAFVEHFESRRIDLNSDPSLTNGQLSLDFTLTDPKYSQIGQFLSIYHDPPPEPHTAVELNTEGPRSYCLGGGFTADCPAPAGTVLQPPRVGFRYTDLGPTDMIASRWDRNGETYRIEANISGILQSSGVYTVVVWNEDHTVPLLERSFFVD